MKPLSQIDAKMLIEEAPSELDGLTRAGRPSAPLRAGEEGTVVHEMTFQQNSLRPIQAVGLAFRGRRYIKSLHRISAEEIAFERRLELHLNGAPVDCRVQAEPGSEVETRTRNASEWWWVRLQFPPRRFGAGDTLRLEFSFDEPVRVPTVAISYLVPVFLVDDRDRWYAEEPMVVRVVGTDAVKLLCDVPSVVRGERLTLRVRALDRIGNPDVGFEDELTCRLGDQTLTAAACGGTAAVDGLRAPAEGMHCVRVEAARSGLRGQSNYFLAAPDTKGGLLWGDIHGHSISSDGIGTMAEHYSYARDVRCMDVAALTDHDNQIIANGAWPLTQRTAREWSEAGRFVVLPAYEWAQPYEAERNYGHKNIYFRTYADNPLLSGDAADATGAETPEGLYDQLEPEQCVIVSHHPAYDSWMWTDWERVRPEREQVIEVYSMHGASDEVETIKPLPDYNAERFILPNMRGDPKLRLGFTGGSDVHAGLIAQDFHPDRAAPEDRVMTKPYRGGLTAFWVEELTLDALLDALRERRTYATTGEKLLLLVEANGRLFEPDVEADGAVELRVRFGGSASVRALEVFRNAELCHVEENLDETFEWRWQDSNPADGASYFVRVTQEDDQIAWSAVAWVKGARAERET